MHFAKGKNSDQKGLYIKCFHSYEILERQTTGTERRSVVARGVEGGGETTDCRGDTQRDLK